MPLIHNTHGKGRVRVMRVHRDGDRNEVRELDVKTMLTGDFAASYTDGDNRTVVATDTIRNLTYIVAREAMQADAETFAQALAAKLLSSYQQVDAVEVETRETRWQRATVDGVPHPHSFTLDANGKPTATARATRAGTTVTSGVTGFTFLKSTQSGWVDYHMDEYTTLPPTTDRIASTAMDATWVWRAAPDSYEAANALVLSTMLKEFATTYSHGIQDSLFRMGEAALAAVPELETIRMSCPNKHYIPMNLDRFGLSSDNLVFVSTDEPHGQIECEVGR